MKISSPRHPPPADCPATGTQAHDLSCELESKAQLMSALPQWPTSPSSRFAEVTNCNQDLTGAATDQVVAWFQNREKLGLIRHWPNAGTYLVLSQAPLLASVQMVLRRHERWAL